MVERDYHHYFPYNKRTKAYNTSVAEERRITLDELTPEERRRTEETYAKELILSQSILERCLMAETVQSLSAIDDEDDLSTVCNSLVTQCQAVDEHTLQEIHTQLITITMMNAEILVMFRGGVHVLTGRLSGT